VVFVFGSETMMLPNEFHLFAAVMSYTGPAPETGDGAGGAGGAGAGAAGGGGGGSFSEQRLVEKLNKLNNSAASIQSILPWLLSCSLANL
jgi:hypothetical protein